MRFSDKIMTLRKQRGWSQEELANQLDVSRQAIYKWESGLTTPELEKIKKLTEIFDTTFEELLNDDKELVLNKKEADSISEPQISEEPVEQRVKYHYNINEEISQPVGQDKKKEISPNKKGKILGFILIGVGALALIITILLLVLHSCEGKPDGGDDPSQESEESSSKPEVVGANCTIQIMTGASDNIQYRVKLTKGEGFKLEIPERTQTCVYFEGYFTEDGVQITNEEGSSLVSWQGEQRYTLYPHYEYKIRTVDDLMALQSFAPVRRKDTYSCVKITLENDLDLSGIKDWEPLRIYPCFDGKGHTIKNLTSTRGGLFADIYGEGDKYVKNLNFENVKIIINDIPGPGYFYIGVLAGWFQGSVENVNVKSGKIIVAKDLDNSVIYDKSFQLLIVGYSRAFENCESNATIEIK